MQHHERTPRSTRRGRGDDGVALVEFALVSVLLFMLIFGIIHFGLLLSFKQDVTRAAAEGARAGAVAFPATYDLVEGPLGDRAADEAWDATVDAVAQFDRTCGANGQPGPDGMTCTVEAHPCDEIHTCVTVTLEYDHAGHPLLAAIPIISGFMPDTVRASSVVRTNEAPITP